MARPRLFGVKIDIIQIDVEPSTMPDIVDEATKDLKAWVVEVGRGHAPAFLERTLGPAVGSGAQILIMRSDMVLGFPTFMLRMKHAE